MSVQVCVHLYSRWMCVKFFLVLMYVFTVLLLCFSDCHESTCAFFFFFFFDCHVDSNICIIL